MTETTQVAPTGERERIARRLAIEAVQSLADSLPDGDAIEAMERLQGTPQASMFCVSAERLEEVVHVTLSNAFADGALATPAPAQETGRDGASLIAAERRRREAATMREYARRVRPSLEKAIREPRRLFAQPDEEAGVL